MAAGGDEVFWGMNAATLVALAGVVLSLGFNAANFRRTSSIRQKSLRLDHFNNCARRPLEVALARVESDADEIEQLLRVGLATLTDRSGAMLALSQKFHRDRRQLDRVLNFLQSSEIIPGNDWTSFRYGECDAVTVALEKARVAAGNAAASAELAVAAKQIEDLRDRILRTLDDESRRLMR